MLQFCWHFAMANLKKIFHHGFSSAVLCISFIGVLLGVSILLIVIPIMDGFHHKLRDTILGFSGHVKIHMQKPDFDQGQLIEQISTFSNVNFIFPTLSLQTLLMKNSMNFGVFAVGLSQNTWQNHHSLEKNLIVGSSNDLYNPDEFSIIIGEQLQRKMHLNIGDEIDLLSFYGNKTIIGNLPNIRKFKVCGIFHTGMQDLDSNVVFLDLNKAQKLFNKHYYNNVEIFLQNYELTEEIIAQLKKINPELQITDWKEENQEFFKTLQLESNIMCVLLFLIIVVATFNITTGMIMFVDRKKNSIAILLTIGARKTEIMLIFLIIGMILGILAMILGNVLAILIVKNINAILLFIEHKLHVQIINIAAYQLDEVPHTFTIMKIIFINLMTFALIFLTSIVPSAAAARKQPVALLRNCD